ncbi:acyltransferase [Atlantibacter hermannii]|uniref:acyltransferase n=1 Tax=Atlantibacter hermannii TaxID=565 RepID=UPI00254ED9D8|nr:acyltransferase [Atlantibacter hermannii]
MAYLSTSELTAMGFAKVGKNVLVSNKASFYGCQHISLDDNVRIDDFCVLSAGEGGIRIGKNVHLAVYCMLMGKGRITLEDFSGLSSRVSIYSSNDDYSGFALTNPTVPSEFTNVLHADVLLKKHVIVGSGAVILPGVTMEQGSVAGALTLISKKCEEFTIYSGNPARRVSERKRNLLDKEVEFNKIFGYPDTRDL